MMQQASFDFGFEAEDLPLMIEAIPSSGDSIVLIITKVEDPEELVQDSRNLHKAWILKQARQNSWKSWRAQKTS